MKEAVWWCLVIVYMTNIPAAVWMIGRPRVPYTNDSALGSMFTSAICIAALVVIRP